MNFNTSNSDTNGLDLNALNRLDRDFIRNHECIRLNEDQLMDAVCKLLSTNDHVMTEEEAWNILQPTFNDWGRVRNLFRNAYAKNIPFSDMPDLHKLYTNMLATLLAAFQLDLVPESACGNKLSYVKHDGTDGGSLFPDIKVGRYGTIALKKARHLSRRSAFKEKWQAVSHLVANRQVLGKEKSSICSVLDDGFNTWTFLSIENDLYYFPRKDKIVEYLLMTLLRWLMVLPGRNSNFESIVNTILQEDVCLTGASFQDRLC
jgi:hypothetical protein